MNALKPYKLTVANVNRVLRDAGVAPGGGRNGLVGRSRSDGSVDVYHVRTAGNYGSSTAEIERRFEVAGTALSARGLVIACPDHLGFGAGHGLVRSANETGGAS